MPLLARTQLMKNQKLATSLPPDKAFHALQTSDGDTLFFSISHEGTFLVTREMPGTETGWSQVCLSSSITANSPGRVKSFAISQHPVTGKVDIALAITAGGNDKLYVLCGISSKSYEWDASLAWTPVPFDAPGIILPSPLVISKVYLMEAMNGDASSNSIPTCFVDIVRNPAKPFGILDRYYILFGNSTTKWNKQALPVEIEGSSTMSCLGYRASDRYPGVYTYGMIDNTTQLIYTPQRNPFRPNVVVNPARFDLPPGPSVITSCANLQGETILFVASTNGLYAYGAGLQQDRAQPRLVVPALTANGQNLFAEVKFVQAVSFNQRTVVWLLNGNKDLFFISCPVQKELDAPSWTKPTPFLSAVDNFSFYLDKGPSSEMAVFANVSGRKIVAFRQDSSAQWTQRSVLLPSANMDDYIEFESFTTTFTSVDANNAQQLEFSINLTAEAPVSVYVNNIYQLLTPNAPVVATADATGMITVIQETKTISAVNYTAVLTSDTTSKTTSSSTQQILEKLSSITSVSDLNKVRITDSSGVDRPLVPAGTPEDQIEAVVTAISQLLNVRTTLLCPITTAAPAQDLVADNSLFKVTKIPTSAVYPVDSIPVAVGDLIAFVVQGWTGLQKVLIQAIENTWQMVVTIGTTVYRAVLDTVNSVMDAVQCVFQMIKVTFKDLVAWLGFVFDWDDILRAAQVLRHELRASTTALVDSIETLELAVHGTFEELKTAVNDWGDISDPGQSIGTTRQQAKSYGAEILSSQMSDPSYSWATYHFNNGLETSRLRGEPHTGSGLAVPQSLVDDLTAITSDLEKHLGVSNSAGIIQQLQVQVMDQFQQLAPLEVLKRVIAICGSSLIDTTRVAVVKVLEIAKVVMKSLVASLDAVVDIPILSKFYRNLTGQDMTTSGLSSLLMAIPSTIAYKILMGASPVPDQSAVRNVTTALDLRRSASMQRLQSFSNARTLDQKQGSTAMQSLSTSLSSSLLTVNWAAVAVTFFDVVAVFATGTVIISSCQRRALERDNKHVSDTLRNVAFAGHVFYLTPNGFAWQNATWYYVIMNDIFTGVSIAKGFLDRVWTTNDEYSKVFSPLFDMVLSFAWMYPAGQAYASSNPKRPEDNTMLWANVVSNLSSIPGFAAITHKEAYAVQASMQGLYGILIGITAVIYGKSHI